MMTRVLGSQVKDMTMEDKKKLMLGKSLKTRADNVRSWITEYYNKGFIEESKLPSGYTMLQFLEALRQSLIPSCIHKNALNNSKRHTKDRATWAARCESSYDSLMKKTNRQTYLPQAWIPFILGGIVRGPRKALPCLITTEEEVKDKTIFQSRTQRRAERASLASVGRPQVSLPKKDIQPVKDDFNHVHTHNLTITSNNNDDERRMKQYKESMKSKTALILLFEKTGRDLTMKKEYEELCDSNFNLLMEFDRFNSSLIEREKKAFQEPMSKHSTPLINEDLTVSTTDPQDLMERIHEDIQNYQEESPEGK